MLPPTCPVLCVRRERKRVCVREMVRYRERKRGFRNPGIAPFRAIQGVSSSREVNPGPASGGKKAFMYRGTSLIRTPPRQDPTVALRLGTNGDPMGAGIFYEPGTPVDIRHLGYRAGGSSPLRGGGLGHSGRVLKSEVDPTP